MEEGPTPARRRRFQVRVSRDNHRTIMSLSFRGSNFPLFFLLINILYAITIGFYIYSDLHMIFNKEIENPQAIIDSLLKGVIIINLLLVLRARLGHSSTLVGFRLSAIVFLLSYFMILVSIILDTAISINTRTINWVLLLINLALFMFMTLILISFWKIILFIFRGNHIPPAITRRGT